MKAALIDMAPADELRDELWTYLVSAAYAMQNTEGPAPGGAAE